MTSTISKLIASTALILGFALVMPGLAQAQSSDTTGRQLTDFSGDLTVPGFDGSLGELAAAELTVAGTYDGQVLQIVNESGGTADFTVSTAVKLCAARMATGAATSYATCAAAADSATIMSDTNVVSETFQALPAGQTGVSAVPGEATDTSAVTVLDPAALADFIDAQSLNFGVATLAGFEALGGGGNSTVRVETFANVTLSVAYLFVNLDVVKLTNGVDGAIVSPGDPVEWTYDIANTGNTALVDVVVTDDLEGTVCAIARLDGGATQRCSLTGIAGDAAYSNIATAIGTSEINPAVTATAGDPSSYVIAVPAAPDPTPTAAIPEPTPIAPDDTPVVSIELSTNDIDADTPIGAELEVGDDVTWRYVVTNIGAVPLIDLIVTDDLIGGVCTSEWLAVGDSFACTQQGLAVQGQHARVSTVTARSEAGQDVTDRDPTHHFGGDEVDSLVITPSVVPVSNPAEPDEVLALTGESGTGAAVVALIVSGLGLVLLSGSEALRRRHTHRDEIY